MPDRTEIDAYIARAAPFARPILDHLRATVHAAEPELTEAIKWGHAFFLLDGRPFAMMAAFKAHLDFGFWLGRAAGGSEHGPIGQFGRITAMSDLPDAATIAAQVRAMAAAARAAPAPRPRKPPRPMPEIPSDLAQAIAANGDAAPRFEGFPPSHRRDYIEWIVEAKRPETRARRIAQAVEQIAEGKSRQWKYEAG